MGDMSKEPSMEEILSSIKRIIAEEGEESTPRGPRRGRLEVVPTEAEVVEPEALDDDILELTPPDQIEAEAEAPVEVAEESQPIADEVVEQAEPEALLEEAVEVEEPIELTPPVEVEEPAAEIAEIAAVEEAEPEALEIAEEPVADIAETETAAPAAEVLELTQEIDTEETVSPSNAALSGVESMISVESEVAARHSLSALSSMIVVPESGEGNTLEELVKAMLKPMLKEWLDAKLPELVEGMVAKEISRITGGVR